ncbi:MAG TPA: hypothetical protein VGN80_14175 [Devosiaceae bacterium]|jgi:hypothetical protein|nr:hypothetical protein [Devosiaceae bacterium]
MKLATITFCTAALALSGPALAGGASDASPGKNKDALITHYQTTEPTGTPTPTDDGLIKNLGGAISGGFYGNTSNSGADIDAPDRGHGVTPSISPGPQTVGGGGPGTGTSIGEFIQSQR